MLLVKMMQPFLILLSLTAALADQAEDFATSSRLFAGDVYNQLLLDNDGNFLVSPFSAETVFALTQSGAVGATGEEIRSVLHLPETQEEAEGAIGSVLPTLTSTRITLVTANKIYVANGLSLKEDFQKVATDVYQAEFQNVEFGNGAAGEINHWVEEKTNEKIKDLFGPDDLDESTKIVLVNALYFNASWRDSFDKYDTKKAKFYTSEENTIDTDFMHQEEVEYNYAESKELDAKILEIPFVDSSASMIFVLPQKKEGVALLEKDIGGVLSAPGFQRMYVKVQIPKFKIETTIDFENVFKKLGIQKAFSPGAADFSGIAGQKGDLFINKVVQKTYIDVNEHGVEAAAATGTGGTESEHFPSASFIADHPFLFYLKFHDVILFEGRVLVPQYN